MHTQSSPPPYSLILMRDRLYIMSSSKGAYQPMWPGRVLRDVVLVRDGGKVSTLHWSKHVSVLRLNLRKDGRS